MVLCLILIFEVAGFYSTFGFSFVSFQFGFLHYFFWFLLICLHKSANPDVLLDVLSALMFALFDSSDLEELFVRWEKKNFQILVGLVTLGR